MAPLADFDAYVAALRDAFPIARLALNAGERERLVDMWGRTLPLQALVTTAQALSRASSGALNNPESGGPSTSTRIVGSHLSVRSPGAIIVIDRLSHQGGISAATAGPQTTNLPTAALTRYTTGEGVWAAITLNGSGDIGTTIANCTMTYTNQDGTSGRTSPAFRVGGSGWDDVHRLMVMPFEGADTGVRSVESVSLSVSTGGGTLGVVLFKPLAMICYSATDEETRDAVSTGGFCGLVNEVDADAHLAILVTSNALADQTMCGTLLLAPV